MASPKRTGTLPQTSSLRSVNRAAFFALETGEVGRPYAGRSTGVNALHLLNDVLWTEAERDVPDW
jgi:hypothetical protein